MMATATNFTLQEMYEDMKTRVEDVVNKGYVGDEYKPSAPAAKAFGKWKNDFTTLNHPAVVEVS